MMIFIAHDTVNDVAIIQTSFCYNVRYGLEVTKHIMLEDANTAFMHRVRHALTCNGHFDPEDDT